MFKFLLKLKFLGFVEAPVGVFLQIAKKCLNFLNPVQDTFPQKFEIELILT